MPQKRFKHLTILIISSMLTTLASAEHNTRVEFEQVSGNDVRLEILDPDGISFLFIQALEADCDDPDLNDAPSLFRVGPKEIPCDPKDPFEETQRTIDLSKPFCISLMVSDCQEDPSRLSTDLGSLGRVVQIEVRADAEGKFESPPETIDKPPDQVFIDEVETAENVTLPMSSLEELPGGKSRIRISGELENPSLPGRLTVRIDPPQQVVVLDMLINPGIGIPTLNVAGLAILIVLLVAIGIGILRLRMRPNVTGSEAHAGRVDHSRR